MVLVWNGRRTEGSPFLKAYEKLVLAHAIDYEQVNHRRIDAAVVREFFGAEPARKTFPNYQSFDRTSLRGRLLSSSYVPEAGQPGHGEMIEALDRVFESNQKEGRVTFDYDTVVYYGRCIPSQAC